ncbi:glypican-6 [Nematostella vectensis]|uniref:glypican-6 n=1 Tax=Nematostella vectensis TaxID=45351 RepID=UPI0020771766|nr:glypican-6 [Nematostella vectensis]
MANRIAWICCLALFLGLVSRVTSNCASVKTEYARKGLAEIDVPATPVSGSALNVCPKVDGCCSQKMEGSFVSLSRTQFETALRAATSDLKSTFANNARTFDGFFRELIKNSEIELNKLYIKTYGVFYQKNAQVFVDLFQELNKYYDGKNMDLSQVMNNFFANLMKQMFQLMNTKYTFSKPFLDCVTEYMDDLQPFGEQKNTLSVQLKRSFVTARTFAQALSVGHSVIKQLQTLSASKDCQVELAKMTYCSWCKGKTDMKPCNALCTDVYKSCLSDMRDLAIPWDNFVSTLLEATIQLEGPFSIENVIVPIGVKISFAIMNYQEKNTVVSQKIFSGCGTPTLSKSKRSTDGDFFLEGSERNKRSPNARKTNDFPRDSPDLAPTTASGTSLGRLTAAFKRQALASKGFWGKLPTAACSGSDISTDPIKCWNGTDFGRYTSPPGVNNNVDAITPSSTIVQQQIIILKTMTQRLKAALEGEEILEGNGGSGSGSGSGSGDNSGNEIDEGTTLRPTTNPNTIDEENNMLGGGKGQGGNTLGKRESGNSASRPSPAGAVLLAVILCFVVNIRW